MNVLANVASNEDLRMPVKMASERRQNIFTMRLLKLFDLS
jgi:hypothetical protein